MTDHPDYDSGLLSGYGGGDVAWWQDYIRAEIVSANDHWRAYAESIEEFPQGVRVDFKVYITDDTGIVSCVEITDLKYIPQKLKTSNIEDWLDCFNLRQKLTNPRFMTDSEIDTHIAAKGKIND